ncbi:MAG: hypothetical protein GX058_00365 [Firmicutes bacterium]|nr:hypothetical protein [Bacillota bacterium]
MSKNPYSRLVLLLTLLSMVPTSFCAPTSVIASSGEWDYLLYPRSQKVQRFNTEFNFHKHIVAIQYSGDPVSVIEDYYARNMGKWGWEESTLDASYGDLGLGDKGRFLYYEQGELACSIIILTGLTDYPDSSLISIEVTDKPAHLRETADINAIAREIAPIPLFPGASDPIIFKSGAGEMQISVSYETNFSFQHVVDFYRRHLEKLGYKEEMHMESLGGREMFKNSYYVKPGSKVIVSISQERQGKTSVLLLITGIENTARSHRQIIELREIGA